MTHVAYILQQIDQTHFPEFKHAQRDMAEVCTLTEESCREVLAEYGWISLHYEEKRNQIIKEPFPPDRHQLIYSLYKKASEKYMRNTGNPFPLYHMSNVMKFARNYAFITHQLLPDLFQILSSAKGCVDHNYAYEVWELATEYPFRKNIDSLTELDLTIQDVWGSSKMIHFHLKQKGRKSSLIQRRRKEKTRFTFSPPAPFTICSYPPEDIRIEKFGEHLKRRGTQILTEEASRTIPFTTSLEDGIDTRETIRHFFEKKLYVKTKGPPPGGVGSIVMIFDEDKLDENYKKDEKFPWKLTWIGEHSQESDMAFYATPIYANIIGPGISKCQYGGFMMSYPPRRMFDIWTDPDYQECHSKGEMLLLAAIDYAVQPVIVYVAPSPPRSFLKSFANRFGKKIVYIPLGQFSPISLSKLRTFHVLDSHDRRNIADEYIDG